MSTHPIGITAMAAALSAIFLAVLVGAVLLTMHLDRTRQSQVERARSHRLPPSE